MKVIYIDFRVRYEKKNKYLKIEKKRKTNVWNLYLGEKTENSLF